MIRCPKCRSRITVMDEDGLNCMMCGHYRSYDGGPKVIPCGKNPAIGYCAPGFVQPARKPRTTPPNKTYGQQEWERERIARRQLAAEVFANVGDEKES